MELTTRLNENQIDSRVRRGCARNNRRRHDRREEQPDDHGEQRSDAANVSIIDNSGTPVHSGTTPIALTLKKGQGYFKPETYTVRFAQDGYRWASLACSRSIRLQERCTR
jgi:hypothetical protein